MFSEYFVRVPGERISNIEQGILNVKVDSEQARNDPDKQHRDRPRCPDKSGFALRFNIGISSNKNPAIVIAGLTNTPYNDGAKLNGVVVLYN